MSKPHHVFLHFSVSGFFDVSVLVFFMSSSHVFDVRFPCVFPVFFFRFFSARLVLLVFLALKSSKKEDSFYFVRLSSQTL